MEGAGRGRYDHRHYGFDIPQHVACCHSQHPVAILFEKLVAIGVALGTVAASMEFAIYFDREPGGGAVEVADIWTDGMLVAELDASLLSPELLP
ncbi:hypothetical protein ASG20_13165 [Sphingomonas sp. Leaf198]|nr:hypothetical protein ASG20_13165 [Sphingomonas sp. Leaf198]